MSYLAYNLFSSHVTVLNISRSKQNVHHAASGWNVEERVQFFRCKGYYIFLASLDLDVYKRNVVQDGPKTILEAGLPRGTPGGTNT